MFSGKQMSQKLVSGLVISGAWNPAILQPNWLAKEAFGVPNGQSLNVKMQFSSIPMEAPRFAIEGIMFSPRMDRLEIARDESIPEDISFSDIEAKAIKILNALSHTPVVAFGENFQYIFEEPPEELLTVFAINDDLDSRLKEAAELSGVQIVKTMKLSDCILNISRSYENGRVLMEFNFHYQVSTAEEAALQMAGTYERNFERTKLIINSYGDFL